MTCFAQQAIMKSFEEVERGTMIHRVGGIPVKMCHEVLECVIVSRRQLWQVMSYHVQLLIRRNVITT